MEPQPDFVQEGLADAEIVQNSEELSDKKCMDQDYVNHNDALAENQQSNENNGDLREALKLDNKQRKCDLLDALKLDSKQLKSDILEALKLDSKQLKKVQKIINALLASDTEYLNHAAICEGGLLLDHIRQKVWPKMVGTDVYATSPRPTKEEVENHPYYEQVKLDVNRSLKRFPPSIEEKQRLALQDQLVLLIMRVLIKHPKFHYYQGYHDICVTFLLVLGEEMSYYVVERLSKSHLEVFMRKNMDPTMEMLNYMYPIIQKERPHLFEFLEKSEVGVMFALSWLITWFGHVLNNYSDVVRLYDFFMASSRWMPVYLSAAIVLYREKEILEEDCDMACVHSLLLNIPDDLPFEKLIIISMSLYSTYPPHSLKETVLRQMEIKKKAMLPVRRRYPKKLEFMHSILGVIKYISPGRNLTFSIILSAVVALSAVLYQSYKT